MRTQTMLASEKKVDCTPATGKESRRMKFARLKEKIGNLLERLRNLENDRDIPESVREVGVMAIREEVSRLSRPLLAAETDLLCW